MTTTTPAEPAKAKPAKTSTSSKPKPRTAKKRPAKRSTFEKVVGIPAQRTREQVRAGYAEKGAETYSDRRLLDIAESVAKIQFWVTLWSALSAFALGVSLLLWIVVLSNN